MISRRTTLILAELYAITFHHTYRSSGYTDTTRYAIKTKEIYDFLYALDYPAWFCNLTQMLRGGGDSFDTGTRELKEFVMKLHTGESIALATKEWTWEQRLVFGQQYLIRLSQDILQRWLSQWKSLNKYQKQSYEDALERLINSLQLDGYEIQQGKLCHLEADVLDTKEEGSVLENLHKVLNLANYDTAFHFLKLSEEHFVSSHWEDSIVNSRKFLESVLQEVAFAHSERVEKIQLQDTVYDKPVLVRDYLEREGLLEKKEKEALSAVYGLLSETGGHPYMARNDQARLLRHLALTFAQFVMLRLKGVPDRP